MLPPELLLPLAQIGTKLFIGWSLTPDHTGGVYSTPPDPLAGLGGRDPQGKREGKGGRRRKGSAGMHKSRVGKPNVTC